MEVNEWLVVYLFCKFHERLGFERILNLQDSYPDCIAEKDGKQVAIEFETKSYFLQKHLEVAHYHVSWGEEVIEKENKYVAVEAGTLINNGTWHAIKPPRIIKEYPKSKYRIVPAYAGNIVQVFTKKLVLDYCVCWEGSPNLRAELNDVKIIELRNIPFIVDFLRNKALIDV